MKCINIFDNQEFYQNSIKKYGITPRGVHWRDKYTQYKRFEIIINAIKDDIKNSTIVDAGCGFGELYLYLNENDLLPKKYIGIDREEKMVEISKNRFPNVEFHCKNVLEDKLFFVDYYVCSGSLNLLLSEDFFNFIITVWKYSKKGILFNFLIDDSFNYIKQHIVAKFCKELTDDIDIFEYYLYNDVTFYLKK